MIRYFIISIICGLSFGIMDAIIHANPLAQKYYEVYKPIAKDSINAAAGIAIDLVYGFVIAGIFVILYTSLPGETGILKGISYTILMWFFRVVMSVAGQWMMYKIPISTLLYTLGTGFVEMLILGVLCGLTLKPYE